MFRQISKTAICYYYILYYIVVYIKEKLINMFIKFTFISFACKIIICSFGELQLRYFNET